MSRLFYVFGNPINHSLSPVIHAMFAKETGLDIRYEKLCLEKEDFAGQLRELLAREAIAGANVTVPFKLDAAKFATTLTERAQRAGATNTLLFRAKDDVLGDNTDGIGFVRDVENRQGVDLTDARILLLGAGGAARGLIAALIEKTHAITVTNRTLEKAEALAHDFNLKSCSFSETDAPNWDIVINATSASLKGAVPPVGEKALSGAKLSYDLMYGAKPTVFLEKAQMLGSKKVADGLGMLIEQAAESFLLWNGVRPLTDAVYEALRRRI